MPERAMNKQVLLCALLVALLIRLFAWVGSGSNVAQAGYLNQTIPTPTPSGQPGNPPTSEPPGPSSTSAPTQPPGVPSETAIPSETAVPTPTGTDGLPASPTLPAPTGTVSATPLLSATATSTPTSQASPATSPSVTPSPSSTSAPAGTTVLPAESTSVPSAPLPAATWTPEPSPGLGASLLSGSCLWMVLGLLLILAGIAILFRWRLTT